MPRAFTLFLLFNLSSIRLEKLILTLTKFHRSFRFTICLNYFLVIKSYLIAIQVVYFFLLYSFLCQTWQNLFFSIFWTRNKILLHLIPLLDFKKILIRFSPYHFLYFMGPFSRSHFLDIYMVLYLPMNFFKLVSHLFNLFQVLIDLLGVFLLFFGGSVNLVVIVIVLDVLLLKPWEGIPI